MPGVSTWRLPRPLSPFDLNIAPRRNAETAMLRGHHPTQQTALEWIASFAHHGMTR
jgi:hypothetical protein